MRGALLADAGEPLICAIASLAGGTGDGHQAGCHHRYRAGLPTRSRGLLGSHTSAGSQPFLLSV